MRKIILAAILIVASLKSNGQGWSVQAMNPTTTVNSKGGFAADSTLRLPIRLNVKPLWWNNTYTYNGATQINSLDSTLYWYWNGNWRTFSGGGGSGVTSISQGYGMILSPNPIISTGSVRADTTLVASKSFTANEYAPISTTVRTTGVQEIYSKTIIASVIQAPKFSMVTSGGSLSDSLLVLNPSTGLVYYMNPARISGGSGTVTSISTNNGTGITGGTITTTGTLAIDTTTTISTKANVNAVSDLKVPYTGATTNVNLGTHSLSAYDLIVNHTSGSGTAASITKGGNGEALTVVKSSGSGNAASITGGVTLLDELHLNTDLADAYIASAAAWNAKQSPSDTTTWDATKQNLADTSAVLRSLIPTVVSAASEAEINTGTDNAKFASPLGLAGSKYLDQSGTKVSGTTAGTSTAYTLTLSPAITAYTAGLSLWVKFHVANTGAATINVNGLGAKSLVKDISTALIANDIPINQWYTLVYDGTNFLIQDIGFGGINLSARLSGALSDETGTGVAVFGTSPAFTTAVTGGATFSAFNTTTTNLSLGGATTTMTIGGTPTTALTHTYSGNATANTITKTINFGTGGASGSTTAINFGSATAGATNTFKFPLLTSGTTDDSIIVADASTGALKRISSARISGGGGGTDANAYHYTGDAFTGSMRLGASGTGTRRLSMYINSDTLIRIGVTSAGFRWAVINSNNGVANNYDATVIGGETGNASGIRSVVIGGVGGQAQGTNSISMSSGIAESTNSWAWGLNSTYANGANSIAFGGYANNSNYTGCFNWADFSETSFSNNTANNQFMAKAAGGFVFKTAAATTRMTIKSTGIVNISNTPTYADNTAALAGGLVAGDVYRTSTGVLMITY